MAATKKSQSKTITMTEEELEALVTAAVRSALAEKAAPKTEKAAPKAEKAAPKAEKAAPKAEKAPVKIKLPSATELKAASTYRGRPLQDPDAPATSRQTYALYLSSRAVYGHPVDHRGLGLTKLQAAALLNRYSMAGAAK